MRSLLLPIVVIAFTLAGCGRHSESTPGSQVTHSTTDDNRSEVISGADQDVDHLKLSKQQVETLKQAIARLQFPQPEGTVESLLPVRDYHRSSVTTFDLHPVGDSPFVINVYDYNLSAGNVLRIRQARYSGRKFCKTKEGIEVLRDSYTLDQAAEILTRDQADKTDKSLAGSDADKEVNLPDASTNLLHALAEQQLLKQSPSK